MIIHSSDFLLLPLYLILLYVVVKWRSKKYAGTSLKKYLFPAFIIHFAGSVLHSIVVQYYYGFGDAFVYFEGGEFIKKSIFNSGEFLNVFFLEGAELENLPSASDLQPYAKGSLYTISSLTAMRFSAFFSLFTFSHYLINAIFCGFLSFIGIWKLFVVFNDILKKESEKYLAIAMIYTPTIWFWGSGMGKDSISLGLLGIMVSSIYWLFKNKKGRFINFIIIILSAVLLLGIKSAVVSITAASLGGYLIINIFQKTKNVILKFLIVLFFLLGIAVFFNIVLNTIEIGLEETRKMVEQNIKNYSMEVENSGGGFTAPNFNTTPAGIAVAIPNTVFSTLYRPFLWESKKIIMLFSALESFLMLIGFVYVIFKTGLIKSLRSIFRSPAVVFCFIFCTLMAMVVGFTTFNFGTMVRYRLPLLPFYIFILIFIYNQSKLIKIKT